MHHISPAPLTLDHVRAILHHHTPVALSDEARAHINHCREYLERKISGNDQLFYGINTGFGSLCDVRISPDKIAELQHNLVVSHAAGMGDTAPEEVVRIMLLLKIQSLSYGHSGVRVEVVQRLVDFYNAGALPVVFELGSLGASGDLAPLAHLSLPLIGLGEMWHEGKRKSASEVLAQMGWKPMRFEAKEALALLNGTQFSTAYGVWCLLEAERLANVADLNAAIAFDGFNCRISPLDENIHRIRPQKGQVQTAQNLRNLLKDSQIVAGVKTAVQDPYCFRCVPQVHGATRDALAHVREVFTVEINAVTDNPNIFPEEDLIVSGGNFHAQAPALPLDYLAIALSELGNISERRVYQLISGQRGLPPFLTPDPGLHSGMMIAQYTAAAIVNQNKTLCAPASSDSIVSCNGQEDHVSMAANAATKARRVVLNLERLLAIEFMVGMQALEYRLPLLSAPRIESIRKAYRMLVPKLEQDRVISQDMEASVQFLRTLAL